TGICLSSCFGCNDLSDMDPWLGRLLAYDVKGLVNRVVWAYEKIRSAAGELFRRGKHEFCHRLPITNTDESHVLSERVSVHADFGMELIAHFFGRFQAKSPVTKRGAFTAACNDPNALSHRGVLPGSDPKSRFRSQPDLRRPPSPSG